MSRPAHSKRDRPLLVVRIRDRRSTADVQPFEVEATLDPGDRRAVGTYDARDVPDELVERVLAGIESGTYDEGRTEAFGRTLFTALFKGDVLDLYEDAGSPRLRLHVEPAGLAGIPWELLHDGQRFASVAIPLSRGLKSMATAEPLKIDLPLRVLVVDAFPEDVARIDAEFEASGIERALDDLKQASVTRLSGVTVTKLIDALREAGAEPDPKPFHVLHFVGHGVREAGSYALLFEDDVERAEGQRPPAVRVGPDELVNVVTSNGGGDLKLVFLNACRSAQTNALDTTNSFAPRILAAGIPAMIGMQNSVLEDVAAEFAKDFYASLADGVPIDVALRDARLAANTINPELAADLGVPVLYMRSDTGRLFEVTPTGSRLGRIASKTLKFVGAAIAAGVIGTLAWNGLGAANDAYCDSDVRPVTWTCAERPEMPTTTFNVAIAEFDAAGGIDRDDAKSLAGTLHESVEDEILEFGFTRVWGPNQTGAVRGATAEEREQAANERADEINADIIVYGRLEPTSGSRVELVPEFYLNDRRQEFVEAGASELTGGYRFGEEESVDPANLSSANQGFASAMEGRSQALAQFVLGLADYTLQPPDYAAAVKSFRAAADIEQWKREEGREILHMFVGNAEGRLATTLPLDFEEERSLAFKRAATAYEESLDIDGQYSRAWLGKAEVQFVNAGGLVCDGSTDAGRMAVAEETYERARSATNKPAHAYVDTKADLGTARIHHCMHIAGLGTGTAEAEQWIQRVIDADEDGNDRVGHLVAEAYGMRALLVGTDGRYAEAADDYLEAAERLEALSFRYLDREAIMYWNAADYLSKTAETCRAADGAYATALERATEAEDEELLNKIENGHALLVCT